MQPTLTLALIFFKRLNDPCIDIQSTRQTGYHLKRNQGLRSSFPFENIVEDNTGLKVYYSTVSIQCFETENVDT